MFHTLIWIDRNIHSSMIAEWREQVFSHKSLNLGKYSTINDLKKSVSSNSSWLECSVARLLSSKDSLVVTESLITFKHSQPLSTKTSLYKQLMLLNVWVSQALTKRSLKKNIKLSPILSESNQNSKLPRVEFF